LKRRKRSVLTFRPRSLEICADRWVLFVIVNRQTMTVWLLFDWNRRDGMQRLVRSHTALKNQRGTTVALLHIYAHLSEAKNSTHFLVILYQHILSWVFFVDPSLCQKN
jgi:hypothetical protein